MPARRGETPTIIEDAMSYSEQLCGFQTSGAFGFGQKRAYALR